MKILSWALVNAITRFYQGLSSEATTCSLSQDSRCPVLLSYQHLETLNLRQRHLQPMSLCQSGSHPFYSMLCRLFKCAPNTETHSWRHRWCCSSLPLVFPELKRWRLLKLQMFFFFLPFDFSRWSSCEEEKVWLWRAGMWLSNTEGPSCASLSLSFFCKTQRRPALRRPLSWFVLQGSNSISKLRERG